MARDNPAGGQAAAPQASSGDGWMLKHITELTGRARRILMVFVAALLFFSVVGFAPVKVAGTSIPMPYPSFYHSASVSIVRLFEAYDVPAGMVLLNVNAFDPLFASMEVSILLSLFVVVPLIILETQAFVSPALHQWERRLLYQMMLPAATLFAIGAIFAYIFVIPPFLGFVKSYAVSMGAEPTLSMGAFVGIIVSFMLVLGISFETPVAMVMLTRLGAVSAGAWRRNWRWGALAAFATALVISPGTTGGIMETVIGTTIFLLYLFGMAMASLVGGDARGEVAIGAP